MSCLHIIKIVAFVTVLTVFSVFAEETVSNGVSKATAQAEQGEASEENSGEDEEESVSGKKKIGFSHYQSIIDRAPFGVPPPGFNREAVPGSSAAAPGDGTGGPMTEEQLSVEEQKIISEVQVSVLSITPAGSTMVGFTDKASHRNYYLKVGAEKDGWKVVSADAAAQSVVLSKGGVEATVRVGSASGAGVDKKVVAGAGVGALMRSRDLANSPLRNERASTAPHNGFHGGSAISRLRQKSLLERQRRMEEESLRKEKEENAKKEIQQMRDEMKAMNEKAEQEAIEREESRRRLMELSEALKRNRESRQSDGEEQSFQSGEGSGEGE